MIWMDKKLYRLIKSCNPLFERLHVDYNFAYLLQILYYKWLKNIDHTQEKKPKKL